MVEPTLIACYVAQMRALVEADKPAANWRTQFAKLADLAALACERKRELEHSAGPGCHAIHLVDGTVSLDFMEDDDAAAAFMWLEDVFLGDGAARASTPGEGGDHVR